MDTKKVSASSMEVYTRELAPIHCTFEVTEFSTKGTEDAGETYGSEIFEAGGCKWSLCLYPKGNKKQRSGEGYISLYLKIEETNMFSSGWEVLVNYKLFVYDQNNDCYLTIQDVQGAVRRFHERKKQWGFAQLISLESLTSSSNGYLVDDTCVFGAEVSVLKATNNLSNLPSSAGTKIAVPDVKTGKPYLPSAVDGMDVYEREQPLPHYSLEIKKFSELKDRAYWSDTFEAGGFLWSLTLYPNGNKEQGGEGHISLYLRLVETNILPAGWEAFVNYKLFIRDQSKGSYLTIQDAQWKVRRFHKNKTEWGFAKLISLEMLKQKSNAYLDNDTCVFGAEVSVLQPPTGKMGFLTMEPQTSLNKITFTLENFSTLEMERYETPIFHYGGFKWSLKIYPIGTYLRYGLHLVDDIHRDREVHIKYKARLHDQLYRNHREYAAGFTWWSIKSPQDKEYDFIRMEDLRQPKNGFLLNDTVIVEVEFLEWRSLFKGVTIDEGNWT